MPNKIETFLQEYRDLVHRHGLGIMWTFGERCEVVEVTDPDAHVAVIADERPSDIKKDKAAKK